MYHRNISLFFLCVFNILCVSRGDYDLTILHTNDVHARIEQCNKYGGSCSQKDANAGKCFGGVARRKTKIDEIRAQKPNTLLLDGGDQFQGTLWFYIYKGSEAAHFMKRLQYDCMAIGNHEFDNGVNGLEPFLRNVSGSFHVLSSNIDASREPSLQGLFNKSVIEYQNGEKIGIVGYTTKTTPLISKPGNLIFNDEIQSVQEQVNLLKSQGVTKIIALGHAGINVDKAIAEQVTDVDIVVGGHTDTFMYTGTPPSIENPYSQYPYVVNKSNGDTVLVVQDFTFGKYLGYLDVTFDDAGKVKYWSGNPILLDSSVAQDPNVLNEVASWKTLINNTASQTIGKTYVFLDGERNSCRLKECNMGNLVTDAMVHQNIKHPDGKFWTNVSIALWNGGGIRASMEPGPITMEDVLTVVPFRNGIDIISLKGEHLLATLEHSVSLYLPDAPEGRFLQVSGLLVTYDLHKPVGNRVVSVEVRCAGCRVPKFEPLDPNAVYRILISAFLVGGGDGYGVIKDNLRSHHIIGDLDSDILIEYIKSQSPITVGLEKRITFLPPPANTTATTNTTGAATVDHATDTDGASTKGTTVGRCTSTAVQTNFFLSTILSCLFTVFSKI